MLALKRIAKVSGRITVLIDSINTIRNISLNGHPQGTKWAKNLFKFSTEQKNNLNHKGKLKTKVNLKWLVAGKTKGSSPIKFNNKIIKNKEIKSLYR